MTDKSATSHRGAKLTDDEFARMWADLSITVKQIGAALGISGQAVSSRAYWRGLPKRPASGRERKQGNQTARCAHPGCTKTIREGTSNFTTGKCQEHQPKPEAKPEAKPKRQGVRLAVVHLVSGCSTLPAGSLVSVSREPWA